MSSIYTPSLTDLTPVRKGYHRACDSMETKHLSTQVRDNVVEKHSSSMIHKKVSQIKINIGNQSSNHTA